MGFIQCVKTQQGAGTLFNTYTTAKSVINPQALWTIPAGYLQVGDYIRVSVRGGISNIVTAQPTFTFQCMMGSIVVFTTGAMTTTTTAHVTIPFKYDAVLRLDTIGSGTSAKFMGQGHIEGAMFLVSGAAADSTASVGELMGPNTAPALGTGFDSTIANVFDFWCGISVSQATNGIQINHYTVELLSERN